VAPLEHHQFSLFFNAGFCRILRYIKSNEGLIRRFLARQVQVITSHESPNKRSRAIKLTMMWEYADGPKKTRFPYVPCSYYYLIELQMGVYPVAVVLQEDSTQKYIYHTNYHTTLKQNTAHKATQTIKDKLRTMNTTQKSNYILTTGCGGL
jgi:hypothetical protein